tara:strand:- start:323 stop:988 length:666 start_codon:yes stop_codon:yes gene_type:complete
MAFKFDALESVIAISILVGIGLGLVVSYLWISRNKEANSDWFVVNDLHQWMIPIEWQDIYSKKDVVQFAKDELKKLESLKKETDKKEERIDEKLLHCNERIREIKKKMENAGTAVERNNIAGTIFSLAMKNLSNLRYESETIIENSLPYIRKTRFLQTIAEGSDKAAVEDIMSRENINLFKKDPYTETFNFIDADWDALTQIPGQQAKIMHKMLSIDRDED